MSIEENSDQNLDQDQNSSIRAKDEDDDDLEENIVGGRDVKLCTVASPVTLHVVDLHTVAIGALGDMMIMLRMIDHDDDVEHNATEGVKYRPCHLIVGEKRVPVFIDAKVDNISPE